MAWRDCLLTIEGGTPLFLCWGDDHRRNEAGVFVRWICVWINFVSRLSTYCKGWYLFTYSLKSSVSC